MPLHPFFEQWALPVLTDASFVRDQGLRWVLQVGQVRVTVHFRAYETRRGYDLLACDWDVWSDSLAEVPRPQRLGGERDGDITVPPSMTGDLGFYRGQDRLSSEGVQPLIWRVNTSTSGEYGHAMQTRLEAVLLPVWKRAIAAQTAELPLPDRQAIDRVTYPGRPLHRNQTNQQRHVIDLVAREIFDDPLHRVQRLLDEVAAEQPDNDWVAFWRSVPRSI